MLPASVMPCTCRTSAVCGRPAVSRHAGDHDDRLLDRRNRGRGYEKGAFTTFNKPVNLDEVALLVEKALETSRLRREVRALRTTEGHQIGMCVSFEMQSSTPCFLSIVSYSRPLAFDTDGVGRADTISTPPDGVNLDEVERQFLVQALEHAGGNRRRVQGSCSASTETRSGTYRKMWHEELILCEALKRQHPRRMSSRKTDSGDRARTSSRDDGQRCRPSDSTRDRTRQARLRSSLRCTGHGLFPI